MYRSGSSLLITLFVALLGLVLVSPSLFAQQSASASKPLVVRASPPPPPDAIALAAEDERGCHFTTDWYYRQGCGEPRGSIPSTMPSS